MFSWVMGMVISVVIFSMGKWKKKMYGDRPEPIEINE